jgi:TrmH family RNA methyltransferase
LDNALKIKELYLREGNLKPDIQCDKVYSITKNIFDKLCETQNSQGIMAVTGFIVHSAKILKQNLRYVLLDRLQDPGNIGAIIRSAAAFGIEGIIINTGCVDPYSPKAVRSAMGALEKVKIIKIKEIQEIIEYNLIAADKAGRDIDSYKWPKGFILAIGNEANGLSQEVAAAASETVSIPISGSIESLNAAVSCGILLFSSR